MESRNSTIAVAGDSGLLSLVLVARIYRVAVDAAQLQLRYGHHNRPCCRDDILRAAKALDFKAKKLSVEPGQLCPESLPAIVRAKDGVFFVLARALEQPGSLCRYLIQRPDKLVPERLVLAELKELWSGEVVLLAPRGSPTSRRPPSFRLRWRIPVLARSRKIIAGILVATAALYPPSSSGGGPGQFQAPRSLTELEIHIAWCQALGRWLRKGEDGELLFPTEMPESARTTAESLYLAHRDDVTRRILRLENLLEAAGQGREPETTLAIESRIDALLGHAREENRRAIAAMVSQRDALTASLNSALASKTGAEASR